MDANFRTDLACEFIKSDDNLPKGADRRIKKYGDGITAERMDISKEASEILNRPKGRYVTLNTGKISEQTPHVMENITELLSSEIVSMAEYMTGKRLSFDFSVLVVGLGNGKMTPDAVGPDTVALIEATRHLAEAEPCLFKKLECCKVSAISPGVLGQTGIETLDLVKGAVSSVHPDLIIAIDALAARSCERLAATVQLSDSGINPGSGIGNKRSAISFDTVGVPVMALGVPTVVDSATLVRDILLMSGCKNISPDIENILNSGKSFFVSPKECDAIIKCICKLFSAAIGRAFGIPEVEYA